MISARASEYTDRYTEDYKNIQNIDRRSFLTLLPPPPPPRAQNARAIMSNVLGHFIDSPVCYPQVKVI